MIKSFFAAIVAAYMAFVGAFNTTPSVTATAKPNEAASTIVATSSFDGIFLPSTSTKPELTTKSEISTSKNTDKAGTQPSKIAPVTKEEVPPKAPIAPDYRQEVLTLLKTAKQNYVDLKEFSFEAGDIASKRKSWASNALKINEQLLPTWSDPDLKEVFVVLNDMYKNEVALMSEYETYFKTTAPNVFQGNISKIDSSAIAIEKTDQTVTYELLVSYQNNYFGSNTFQKNRSTLQAKLDKLNQFIDSRDALYEYGFDQVEAYVNSSKPQASSVPIQSAPPPLWVPELPKTTFCDVGATGIAGHYSISCQTLSM